MPPNTTTKNLKYYKYNLILAFYMELKKYIHIVIEMD